MPEGTYQLGSGRVREGRAARLKDGTWQHPHHAAGLNLIAFGITHEDAARMVTEAPALSIKDPDFGRRAPALPP